MIKRILIALLAMAVMLLPAAACAEEQLQATANYILQTVTEPGAGSEWAVLAMRAADIMPQHWRDAYVLSIRTLLENSHGELGNKNTEYSKIVLALTAAGENAADINGYNLLQPLYDFDKTIRQGINGAVFALLALDCADYAAPANLRDMYLEYILSKQLEDGGFALSGKFADADVTAMVLCAISAYTEKAEVQTAMEEALQRLSEMQKENGGYASYGTPNAESCAQVILALTSLGIDLEDTRFLKNGYSVLDAMLEYCKEDNSFCHTVDGNVNWMSTQQAFLALAALERAESGLGSVYVIAEEQCSNEA